MPLFAVLTGDIVRSSELDPGALDEIMSALDTAARDLSGWAPGMSAGFARRGGDGWQIVHDNAVFCFRAALWLQAVVRRGGKDRATRIALATGSGALDPQAIRDPNAASGPAFTASGRLLETLKHPALMAHADGGALSAALRLADHIGQGWTQAQARALCEALPPGAGPRAEAAERLGITRQAVNQALWGAGFPALEEALELLEGAA